MYPNAAARRSFLAGPVPDRWALPVVVLFGAAASVALVVLALSRGLWLDEFATVYFAEPALSLSRMIDERWLRETNPPTYYALARLWAALLGADPITGRLLNLVPLTALAGWFARSWYEAPDHRRFLTVYAVMALSNRIVTGYFPEYRSYFFQYAAETIFFGASYLDFVGERRRVDGARLLAVPFLVGLHQVTAIYAIAMILCLIIVEWRRRFFARAVTLGLVTLISLAPLLAFTQAQIGRGVIVPAWIEPHSALWALGRILSLIPSGPRLLWWGFAGGLVLLIGRRWWPHLAPSGLMTPPPLRLRFTGVVLAALAVGSVVAITINGVAPLLVTRYFTAVAVAGSGLFAVLAQDVLFAYPILATLFAASAAVSFGINAVSVGRERGWDQGAQRLLTLTLACPTTRIHVGSHPRLDHEDVGYAYYAVKLGLVLDPSAVRPDGEGGGGCPTVFWVGQFGTKSAPIGLIGADLVEATNHAAGLGLTPDEMARAHVELVDRGAILVVAPEP